MEVYVIVFIAISIVTFCIYKGTSTWFEWRWQLFCKTEVPLPATPRRPLGSSRRPKVVLPKDYKPPPLENFQRQGYPRYLVDEPVEEVVFHTGRKAICRNCMMETACRQSRRRIILENGQTLTQQCHRLPTWCYLQHHLRAIRDNGPTLSPLE